MDIMSTAMSSIQTTQTTVIIATILMNTTTNTTAQHNPIRDENLALIEVATLGTLFVLIVFGNCCVLLALALRPLKMTRMYYYLLHLCISDLITGFCTVLPQLAWDITYRFYGGNILCKCVKCMQLFGPYLSSYVLVVTAIDRYQAICFPLSNCSWTPRRSKLMVTCAWIISIVCSSPQTFIFSYRPIPGSDPPVYDCWGTFPQPFGERIYVTWYAISVFFIPLVVLIFTHFYICREIWVNVSLKRQTDRREKQSNRDRIQNSNKTNSYSKSRKCLLIGVDRIQRLARRARRAPEPALAVGGDDLQTDSESRLEYRPNIVTFDESSVNSSPRVNTVNRLSRAKIKTVKITVVVILCYIVCSSPFIFVQLWAYWVPSAQNSSFWTGPIITILMLLSSLNSFVNPFIYLYFNQNLVKSLLHYCCRMKLNEEFIINKTNASELNSNYDNRVDTQSFSTEDENRVNVNTFALNHNFVDNDNNVSSKFKNTNFRTNRRLNIKRKNTSNSNIVNV